MSLRSATQPAPQPGSHTSSRNQRRCGRVRARLHLCATEVTLALAPAPALSLKAAPSDSLHVNRWVHSPVVPRNLFDVQIVIHFYINKMLTHCWVPFVNFFCCDIKNLMQAGENEIKIMWFPNFSCYCKCNINV